MEVKINILERKMEILQDLSHLIHNETDEGYDKAICEYVYEKDYDTIDMKFDFWRYDKHINRGFTSGIPSKMMFLAMELRSLMKEHTGGEWTSFTLTLDKDGNATTKFVYPED